MQLFWGFSPGLVIGAAVEHGYFDALASGAMSADELAAFTQTSVRSAIAILEALLGIGLVARDRNGHFVLAPESETFLVSSHPAFLGGMFKNASRDLIPRWLAINEVVKTGLPSKPVNQESSGAEFFQELVESLFALNFQAAIALARGFNFPGDTILKVLDIAAGSGVWGIAFAKVYPNATVYAADWEGVLPVTRRVAERQGVAHQMNYIPGDIDGSDLGNGYDVATLGHILHSEGEARSRRLMKRVFDALKPGGTIAIGEFLTNAERTGPPNALFFSVNMLVATTEGRTFSFEELAQWLTETGFTDVRALEIPGPSPLVLATKPA